MSSDHAYHQRNSTGRPPAVAHEYAQEKRAWSVSSEEEIHYGLAKRARTAGSLYTPNNAGPFLVKLSHEAYTVGWVCALHLEMAAAQAMLDYRHQPLDMNPNDSNVYTFGGIGPHNIVIACLPSGQYGTNSAAVVANNMRWSFPSIHIGLMVGIGGGVPGKVDIRLGDVVVSNPTADSPGVVQYDFGKAVNDGRFERIGSLNKPSLSSLAAVSKLRADHEARPSEISRILSDMARRNDYMVEYTRQFVDEDRLFEASYKHSGETCENCDRSKLVPRSLRPTNNPSIHYGIIASGNQLMKNAGTRDRLAKDLGLICFEMEAAGLMDNFPCLVIRGICDYSDSHKAKRWQKYAAATAAAYARELLLVMPPQGHSAVQTQLEVQSTATPSANRKWLLDSLKFDQIDKRHANIKANHAKTCEWLLEHPAYTTWIDRKKYSQHHGFLWIRGKPGAGKSTIMKFAFTRARRRAASIGPSISFFFNARGEGLEKSTLGMYRSLLHQLLEKIPDLQFLLDTDDDQQETAVWDLEKTKTLFRSAVRELGKRQLTCFIDALDECAESEIREMVEVFEDLGQYAVQNDIRFYVCFSSRHYPHIDIQYGQKLTLEDQTGHEKDLAEYVRSSLKAGTGPKSDEIIAEILQKASGVFMWVVLVVDILNREYLRGRLFAVKSRLKEIPSKLSELFQNILTRDQENLDDLLLCIQWVLYSSRPLKREEYYFALASGLEPDTLGEWDPDEIPCEFMDRLIVSSSKGLAETTRSDDKTVQFIHESVRDYLLKDNGLRTLWPDMAADFEAQSHNRLRDCCHEYSSQVNISGYLQDDDHLLQSSKRAVIDLKAVIERGFPFLEYATSQVLYHANAAAPTDLQTDLQTEFLQSFPLKQWTQRSNIFEKHMTRRQKHDTTNLLYIVAERGLSELVKTTLRHNPDAEIRGGRYGYPLLAALKGGHEDVAKLLLECIESSTQKAGSSSYSTPESENSSYVPPSINYSDKQGRTPLYFAAERGQVDIAKTLFGLGAQPDLIPKNISYSPLVRAVEKGQGVLAELILERRSAWQSRATTNANLQSSSSMDKHEDDQLALVKTAENGNIDMAKILLRNGVSVDAGSELYHAPLAAAVQRGQKPFIEFLLDEGADINRGDLLGGKKPIQVAARKSTPEFIHLLAQRGCDLEGRDACGSTPLHIACKDSKKSSVMALLEAGANPYAQDVDGNTPLLTAVQYNEPVVKDLLLHYSKLERNGKITSSHEESQEAFDSGLPNFRLMVNKIGQTPLFRPSPHHDTHVLSDLLDAGLDPSHQDNEGQNFLHRACEWFSVSPKYLEGVKKAIEKGLEIDGRDYKGRTPLMNAAAYDNYKFAEFLLQHRANPNARDNKERTPLSEVISCEIRAWKKDRDLATLRSLLEGGADATEPGPNGEKLLDMAHRVGNHEMADILRGNIEARGVT